MSYTPQEAIRSESVQIGNPGSAPVSNLGPQLTREQAFLVNKARSVAEFCMRQGKQAFEGWPVTMIFSYVFYHLVDGTCFVTRSHGQIAGVVFVWGMPAKEILARGAAGDPPFNWTRSRSGTDALFMGEAVSSARELPKLFKLVVAKFPNWQEQKIFTKRLAPGAERAELMSIPHDTIKRLVYGKTSERRMKNEEQAGETPALPGGES